MYKSLYEYLFLILLGVELLNPIVGIYVVYKSARHFFKLLVYFILTGNVERF